MATMTQMSRVMLGSKTVAPSFTSLRPRTLVTNAARGLWLPDTEPPAHLKGELAGDRGFDPLGLGSDSDRLKWWALPPLPLQLSTLLIMRIHDNRR